MNLFGNSAGSGSETRKVEPVYSGIRTASNFSRQVLSCGHVKSRAIPYHTKRQEGQRNAKYCN